jgi:hypothetical protein
MSTQKNIKSTSITGPTMGNPTISTSPNPSLLSINTPPQTTPSIKTTSTAIMTGHIKNFIKGKNKSSNVPITSQTHFLPLE